MTPPRRRPPRSRVSSRRPDGQSGSPCVELSPGPLSPSDHGAQRWVVEVIDLATSANTLLVEEGRPATVAAAHRCILGAFDAAEDIDEVSVVLEPYQYLWAADPLSGSDLQEARRNDRGSGGRVIAKTSAPADA